MSLQSVPNVVSFSVCQADDGHHKYSLKPTRGCSLGRTARTGLMVLELSELSIECYRTLYSPPIPVVELVFVRTLSLQICSLKLMD